MTLNQTERFFQYVQIQFLSACWEWRGWTQADGYGRFRTGGRGSKCIQAHRWMWEYFHERPVPARLEIDHQCENCRCVNPLHLVAVTPEQNKSQRFGRRYNEKFDYAA